MNLGGSVKINKCGMLIVTLILLIVVYYISFQKRSPTSTYGLMKNPNEINLRKLLIGSIQAAQKGGDEVRAVSTTIDIHTQSKGKTKEGANDPITDADLKSHCAMQQGLQRIFPKLKIISEEDTTEIKCPDVNLFDLDPTVLHHDSVVPDESVHIDDVTVWIDPLDATKEYTEQLFHFVTTMVCVAVKGRPIIGVIHNPFTKKTTWAWEGQLMSEDLEKVKRDEATIKNPIIIVSRSHSGEVKDMTKKIFGESTSIISAGGAGYKIMEVIFNNASAYIHSTEIKKWDICAGNAILNALGGRMTNLKNQEIMYNVADSVVNENGLLAALANHEYFIEKILNKEKTTVER